MLVRCPKCRTTYKVSDELLKGSAPAFRCSRCKHTFELESNGASDLRAEETAEARSSADRAPVDEELSLPFEAKDATASSGSGVITPDDSPPLEPPTAEASSDDVWSIDDAVDQEPEFAGTEGELAAAAPKNAEDTKEFEAQDRFFSRISSSSEAPSDDPDNVLALSSYLEQRGSILPFVSLLCLLVVGFALFSMVSYANPQNSEAMIRTIPLLGPSALRNNHLRQGILVKSLRSSYQTIQGNREVFLITGVIINQNPEVVREVQLSAITYNDKGEKLERQTIWVGNTISPKIIRGMTAEDIPHLQELKPLKTFELPPGDSIPFTVVFLKSAKNAKTFSYEVLAAEGRS